mgnify:CR=1 FL=1
MFFDTHVHFDGLTDVGGAIARAGEAGVNGMVAVGGSHRGNEMAAEIACKYRDRIITAAGFDREHAGRGIDLTDFEAFVREKNIRAIGEIGLDYHYHPETSAAQKELLAHMLELARKLALPAIIHTRNADEDTLEVLRQYHGAKGVIHCFTGDSAFAGKLLNLGLYISFSGIITFRNAAQVREAAKIVPDDRLLIETDSPYLAPEPPRGKTNEPAYVRHVAEALAGIRGCSIEKVAEITTANSMSLFGYGT